MNSNDFKQFYLQHPNHNQFKNDSPKENYELI